MGLLEDMEERLKRLEEALGIGVPFGNYVDQKKSPLGPKKHCAAVKRRKAQGDERAIIIKRIHLLSPDALKEELRLEGSPIISSGTASEDDAFYRDLLNRSGAEVTNGKRDTGQGR